MTIKELKDILTKYNNYNENTEVLIRQFDGDNVKIYAIDNDESIHVDNLYNNTCIVIEVEG